MLKIFKAVHVVDAKGEFILVHYFEECFEVELFERLPVRPIVLR